MDNLQEMELRLWDYIDGRATEPERRLIDTLLSEQAAWRAKYNELLQINQMLGSAELEEPSMRFTRSVMEEIAKLQITPSAKKYLNNKIIWGIGIFFLTMLAGFLVYGIAQIDWTVAGDSESALGVDLGRIDFSRMFDNTLMNIFMMMNVILGLMLLDRFLAKKRMERRQGYDL
ncbi:MAG TPA: hypothetical protein VFZ78_07050 [Flavisolibacter sp.]